ncbi:MAG: hypothetical protein GF320_00350 [Armatimonadia bacterium]|nr:hypothetical protein [Armatimonadia bacterium]
MTWLRNGGRGMKLAMAAGLALAFCHAALASSFQYTSEKREIKVGILLVQSARANTDEPMSRVNLEDPDPHIFWILERSPFKPANWEFTNPLAPSVVTQEILERWDFRYRNGGGFNDPAYATGDPDSGGTRVVDLGDSLPKNSGAYWEVLLTEENFGALLEYDLLFVTNHSLTAFSREERNLLRRLIDAGGTVLVDDCGGMRIVHANEDGEVPVTDFDTVNPAPPAGSQFLPYDHEYFELAYFTAWGGGSGLTETDVFNYDEAPLGFAVKLQFNDDTPGSGWARVADPFHPLLNVPYPLSQDELNEIGDKGITSYRISAYDPTEMYPVVANTAFDTPDPDHAPYGEPHIAMGYYGEGVVIACSADVGCAVNDKVTGGLFHMIQGQWNSGYWCGNDFTLPDTDPRYIGSVKFFVNAVNLAATWRQGMGGPHQAASLESDVPNAMNASVDAAVPTSPSQTPAPIVGAFSGHHYTASSNNVLYVVGPVGAADGLFAIAIDTRQGRDMDADGNPDDGLLGTPAPPLDEFSYPDFDVIWAVQLTDDPELPCTPPVLGKSAYDAGGGVHDAEDILYVGVDDEVQAYRALPTVAGGYLDTAAQNYPGWTGVFTLSEPAQGLTYSRGRLYVTTASPTPTTVQIVDAADGSDLGAMTLPGDTDPVAHATLGTPVALVEDQWNGAIDETLYVGVTSTATPSTEQVLAIVVRSWDESLRPVGTTATGTAEIGGSDVSITGCYANWRIRDFARFDGQDATTAPDQDDVTITVNGVTVDPDYWDFVYDDPAGAATPDPDVPGFDGDWQQIRFISGPSGEMLKGLVPGGTTAGVPADAEVLATYRHKLPNTPSLPIAVADAGSIKWRYIATHRVPGAAGAYTLVVSEERGSRLGVDQFGTVVFSTVGFDGATLDPSAAMHVLHDAGYPDDLYDAGGVDPDPTAAIGDAEREDEVDQAGSFVFWQESPRDHMGYALQFIEQNIPTTPDLDLRPPTFSLKGNLAVVRNELLPIHPDDPDLGGTGPDERYSAYTTIDIEAPMAVYLGNGTGDPTQPPLPLRADWTDGDVAAGDYRPYGVRLFDVWSMQPIPYTTLDDTASGLPTAWWVDPATGGIHFQKTNLAGRRILVQVEDTTTDPAGPIYYHEYHQVPPVVLGQYPAMTARTSAAIPRPEFNGGAIAGAGAVANPFTPVEGGGVFTNVDDWITPLAVDWENGLVSFHSGQLADAVDVDGQTFEMSRVNEDFVGNATAVLDPQFRSVSMPVIAGEKAIVHGLIGRIGDGSVLNGQSVTEGLMVLDLTQRDGSFQDTANEPWPGASPPWWNGDEPGAPWPSYTYQDEGTPDEYVDFWSTAVGDLVQNPSYDLLGSGRAVAIPVNSPLDVTTPTAPPAVTEEGVLTASILVDGANISPRYQWWTKQDTIVASQNRLLVVGAGRDPEREIPSTGISEVLGNLTLPGTLEAAQGTFKGINRPTTVRGLGYVDKPANYYVCDSGNDQIIEVSQSGIIETRISNRTRPAFGGGSQEFVAFYDVPAWYTDLPQGSVRTISSPHDAYRWEIQAGVDYSGVVEDWIFEFDWIADTGNSRLLGLMRQIPPDPTIATGREDEYHLVWASDSYQGVLDPTGSKIERGPALQYVTSWPLRVPSPLSDVLFSVADAPGSAPFGMGSGNFAGLVAGINNVALSTVPGDRPNRDADIGRPDPYPRYLGPGATVAKVGRLYDTGGGLLDAIDDQIQWAFSELYIRAEAPTGGMALMPFKKLSTIHYIDVDIKTGPDVPTGDPAVYYLTIADESGVYPVTYYPAVGPWAATNAAFPGFAVIALPPDTGVWGADAGGYGATWWFDAMEYATTMGSLARGINPNPKVFGSPNADRSWPGPGPGAVYPAAYTGIVDPADRLLADSVFAWFRPVHVEAQPGGQYLVTNGHERKGEVLVLDAHAIDPAGDDPTTNPYAEFDVDYLNVLNWILPDPDNYAGDEVRNTPSIGDDTYGLGQPWSASRRQNF